MIWGGMNEWIGVGIGSVSGYGYGYQGEGFFLTDKAHDKKNLERQKKKQGDQIYYASVIYSQEKAYTKNALPLPRSLIASSKSPPNNRPAQKRGRE